MLVKEFVEEMDCSYEAVELILNKCGVGKVELGHKLSNTELDDIQRYLKNWNKVDKSITILSDKTELEAAKENLSKVISEFDYIFITATSLINFRASQFLKNCYCFLKESNSRIYITRSEWDRFVSHIKNEKKEYQYRHQKTLDILEFLQIQGLVEIYETDREFLSILVEMYMKYKICVLTNSKQMKDDLYIINGLTCMRYNRVVFKEISENGFLMRFDNKKVNIEKKEANKSVKRNASNKMEERCVKDDVIAFKDTHVKSTIVEKDYKVDDTIAILKKASASFTDRMKKYTNGGILL